MHFADRLAVRTRAVGNPVLVGIDPRPAQLPPGFLDKFGSGRVATARAFAAFGREVVEVVAPLVPAVKFQAAFYEALGPEGLQALHETATLARRLGLIVIIDGKRNDIGSTAEAYAQAYLDAAPGAEAAGDGPAWDADALTVTPYLGGDGIEPFLKVARARNNGIFVLVRTSNPSAGDFQDLIADGRPLYRHVAERVAAWAAPDPGACGYGLLGAVVGATYPTQLAELRVAMPDVVFLVPGYGAQGGSAADVAAAFDDQGLGAIINNSRGVTFAYESPRYRDRFGAQWTRAIEQAVRDMADDLAAHTPAGRLRG